MGGGKKEKGLSDGVRSRASSPPLRLTLRPSAARRVATVVSLSLCRGGAERGCKDRDGAQVRALGVCRS